MVVAAAGNLDHARLVRRVRKALAGSALDTGAGEPVPHRDPANRVPARRPRTEIRDKDTEQAHLVLGGLALGRLDPRRFALGVLNNSLGGGMSSRLFQEIREKRGLAYSVYSYTAQYAETGLFAVYAGCAPGKVGEVLDLVHAGLFEVAEHGLTDAEVARGKGMSRGSLVLGLEDSGSRMSRLGKGELLYDELLSVDDLLAAVDAVTPEDVRAIAAEVLARPMSLAAIGPTDEIPTLP
jgi:predicted Zn-dependent peptidase